MKYVIEEELVNKIMTNLAGQSYASIFGLIEEIQKSLVKYEEPDLATYPTEEEA